MPIKYIRIDSELGAGTRGASLGYQAMRVSGHNRHSALFQKYPTVEVEVLNELLYQKSDTPYAIHLEGVVEVLKHTADAVAATLREGKFPMVLSGDHSVAAGTIAGIKKAFPEKRLGVLWVDAHADLHSPYSTPSGNVHGMPLGASLGYDHKEFAVNTISQREKDLWESMKNISGQSPNVKSEDVIFFGVRDLEEAEKHIIQAHSIKNYSVDEVRFRGMEECMGEAIERLHNCDILYLSFDVDSMDCHLVSKGTGTPVPKGFDPAEIEHILVETVQSGKLVCMETVEINPTLDEKQNKMADTAFDLLSKVIPVIEKLEQ